MTIRIFVAGAEVVAAEAPAAVEEAYDLLVADGVPPQRAADMAVLATRAGKDPVSFARHFITLRASVRSDGE